MFKTLLPKPQLDESDVNQGLNALVLDAAFGQTMAVLTTGAFLIGFALAHGASNSMIGVLGALGPMAMVMQVPAVWIIQRVRLRKIVALLTALISRGMWFVIPFLPFMVSEEHLLPVFLTLLLISYAVGNICGCAFNSWIRDLVPEDRFGSLFSRRWTYATAVSALISLVGGFSVDYWKDNPWLPGGHNGSYTFIFLLAAVSGMISAYYLLRTPEPRMPEPGPDGFWASLRAPLRDRNFRQLLIFLGSWSFAVNFATPFFAVYLLERLGLSMSWVIGLAVFSQMVNVVFFRYWAAMADRFTNKSVLLVTVPMFIVTFLFWPFTNMYDRLMLTIPVLILIHAVAGVGTAGVNLCAGSLAFKLAPYGQAGSYLAVNSLVSGVAASISPVIAGFSADWFGTKQLTITLKLASTAGPGWAREIPTINFEGLDFIFFIAFLLGMYALHRLLSVSEEGEAKESVVRQEVFAEMIRAVRQVSTVAGVRQIIFFPFAMIRGGGNRQGHLEE